MPNDASIRRTAFPTSSLPLVRPHTAHASSPQWFDDDNSSVSEESDTQLTPRASFNERVVTEKSVEKEMARDDTATDLNSIAGPSQTKFRHLSSASLENKPSGIVASGIDEERSARPYFQRSIRRNPSERTCSSASVASTNSSSSMHSIAQMKAASLGRRFSRKYQDKMADLKENIQRHATVMPSRIRRASTSQTNDHTSGLQPVSPSKRNGRHTDSRPKKIRPGLSASFMSDRKDTPAPPAFGISSIVPVRSTLSASASALWPVGGGAGARKAVAAYKAAMSPSTDDFWSELESVRARGKERVGSLSSAADSGADLSTYSDPQYVDRDGDINMADRDKSTSVTLARNFLSFLPREICLNIFEHLDPRALLRTECVSHAWRSLCIETSVWRAAFFSEFKRQIFTDPPPIQVGGIGVGRRNQPQQEWRKMYKARCELETNWRKGVQLAGKAIYLSGHTDSVYCLQFDEEKIITGSRDRTIRVWDINTFQCLRVIGGPNVRPVLGPKVLRTVDYPAFHLATASVNGTAYGDSIYHVPSQWHDASILCLQYDDEILVTGSSDSDLLIWDVGTYEPIKRLRKHTGGVLDVALDAKHIVSCSKDSRIIVWDRKTLEPKGDLTGHQGPVNAVQLRGKYLVSASGDGIARLWDIEQMKLIKEFSAKERGLAAVEFSEDMKYVLAGGNDHITYKFETDTGREVQQFTGHTQLVRSLWLDSANKRVVSGSYDLDLRVYDFVTGQEVWRAEEWTTSWMLAAKSDYRRIVATSQDGRILVVDFGLHKGGCDDGEKIENLELLRGTDHTTAITFTNPWIT